jgi:transmembrane sensor
MPIRFPRSRSRRIQEEAANWRTELLEPHSSEVRAEFEAWIAKDPAHARAYNELAGIATLSKRLPAPNRRSRQSAVGGSFLRPAYGVAVVGAIAVAGVLLVTGREPAAAYAAVTNAGPAIRMVRLSDGSTIILDVDTALDVAVRQASREVRFYKGRARFNVADKPARPFTVSSAAGCVTANGSEFDVGLNGDQMTVVPLQGKVELCGAGATKRAPISAGTAVRVHDANVTTTTMGREDRFWPAGRMSFDNTPLDKIVVMANRIGEPPIRLGSDDIGALEVTAVLDLRDTRSLARKLAAALDLKVDERADEIVLTK